MMKYAIPAAIVLAAASHGAAFAQVAPGQSVISSSTPLSNVKAYRELQKFGECIARNERRKAAFLLGTEPGSAAEEKAFDRMIFGEDKTSCLFGGTTMSMPTVYARGAVAEGVLRNGGLPSAPRLSAPTPKETSDLHGVARCYASGHRSEVQALLATPLGTQEEVKTVAKLWDGFRSCMPEAKVRLNAPWIRFLLAEALLRLEPSGAAGAS